jgi:hypothetical protein
MTFIVFQPGDYMIGSAGEVDGLRQDEQRHRVTLTRPFAILDRSVTRGEVEEFGVKSAIDEFSPTLDCPMVGTNWFEAVLYCRWLTERLGMTEEDQPYPSPESLSQRDYPFYPDTEYPRDWPLRPVATRHCFDITGGISKTAVSGRMLLGRRGRIYVVCQMFTEMSLNGATIGMTTIRMGLRIRAVL